MNMTQQHSFTASAPSMREGGREGECTAVVFLRAMREGFLEQVVCVLSYAENIPRQKGEREQEHGGAERMTASPVWLGHQWVWGLCFVPSKALFIRHVPLAGGSAWRSPCSPRVLSPRGLGYLPAFHA